MSGWDRIEVGWLIELFEDMKHPWKEGAVLAWLRHAERACRRGEKYWTPKTAAPQIEGDARAGRLPGRRAVASITGIAEERARLLLADWHQWIDPYSVTEDLKAGVEPGPAGSRAKPCPPASPPSSPRVNPELPPGDEAETQVEPSGGPRVTPASTPSRPRVPPDRARDLRARPPDRSPVTDHESLSPSAEPETADPPPPAPSTAASGGPGPPAPAAAGDARPVVWAAARVVWPDLPVWRQDLLPRMLARQDAAALCRVLDWARLAPDTDAAAIRHAQRSRARGALGPAYALDRRWLGDRLGRAAAWEAAGRPWADDALPTRAEVAAREAERWGGWRPPSEWTGTAPEWVELGDLVEQAERARGDGGIAAQAADAVLRQAAERGWRRDWPTPRVDVASKGKNSRGKADAW